MKDLIPFKYNSKDVRVINKGGEPWWVLKDVCEILELTNSRVVSDRLDNDEVSKTYVADSLGRQQETTIINEPGLYNVILRSDKPEAKEFKRWVTHEVIPSIRKTGMYAVQPQIDSKFLFQIAEQLQEKEKQIQLMKPKADFFDAVAESKSAIDMSQAAKVLEFGKGRTTLFKILREMGVLRSNNEPYQEYVDRGYFRVVEQKFTKPDGSTSINIKTLVYQKGLDFIRKLLNKQKTA